MTTPTRRFDKPRFSMEEEESEPMIMIAFADLSYTPFYIPEKLYAYIRGLHYKLHVARNPARDGC